MGFRSSIAHAHPLLWVVIASVAALTAAVISMPLGPFLDAFVHDDSFYYMTVAENFAAGLGSTFDGVNFTNGYQPGWLLILALLRWIGVGHAGILPVAIGVQAALAISAIVLVATAFARLQLERAAVAAAMAVVWIAIVPILAWNLLESGLTFAASALLLLCLVSETSSPAILGLVIAIAALARTDHLVFAPICGLWMLSKQRPADRLGAAVAFAAPLVIINGGYLATNLFNAGHIMPVSGRVKALNSVVWARGDILSHLVPTDIRQSWKIGWLTALVLVYRGIQRRNIDGLTVYAIGALSIIAYYQYSYSGGLRESFWYYIPAYILLAYAVASTFHLMVLRVPRVATASMFAVVLVAVSARATVMSRYLNHPPGERADLYQAAMTFQQLRRERPGSAAAWDAGLLGYYGGGVTNLDGLVNSADYFERYLSQDRTADYIREHAFDYLICHEKDLRDGGRAVAVLDDYRTAFAGYEWVILERKNK